MSTIVSINIQDNSILIPTTILINELYLIAIIKLINSTIIIPTICIVKL